MRTVVVVVVGGGAAYLAWRAGLFGGAAQQPQQAGPQFVTEQGQGGIGSLLAPLAGLGPIGAAAAAGGAILEGYTKLPDDQKRQLQRTREKLHNTFIGRLGRLDPVTSAGKSLGILKSPTDERRSKRRILQGNQAWVDQEIQGSELHAQRMWAALARPDVEAWAIDQEGTLAVRYAGRGDDEWRLPVPKHAINPAAWAFELSSRLFGAPIQGGSGPIEADFVSNEEPGFSWSNPFAPATWNPEGVNQRLTWLGSAIAKKHV